MPYLTYEGPGHRLLAFGKELLRGDAAEFTDQEARSLAAQPHLRLSASPAPAAIAPDRPSRNGSRHQWADYADTLGVAVTDEMSRDDIAAATELHAAPPGGGEPEAQQGEGHDLNDQKEQ